MEYQKWIRPSFRDFKKCSRPGFTGFPPLPQRQESKGQFSTLLGEMLHCRLRENKRKVADLVASKRLNYLSFSSSFF